MMLPRSIIPSGLSAICGSIRLAFAKLARRVRGIITVSAFSKERLISRLRVEETKIHVVPNGLSEEFRAQARN